MPQPSDDDDLLSHRNTECAQAHSLRLAKGNSRRCKLLDERCVQYAEPRVSAACLADDICVI